MNTEFPKGIVPRPGLDPDRSEVVGVFQPDGEPHHSLCHARRFELLVAESVLRRQHRQAAETLHAAEARRALDT